jgi:glyoxylase-like metal-dependent hydrolase (beta-lactamase superfamily II)
VDGQLGIGDKITNVQEAFKKLFNAEPEFITDDRLLDQLFKDANKIHVGDMDIEVVHTPGHTPACITYIVGNAAFVGDTLFMQYYGTPRTDFPGGEATSLYRSIKNIHVTTCDNTTLYAS